MYIHGVFILLNIFNDNNQHFNSLFLENTYFNYILGVVLDIIRVHSCALIK